MESIEEYFNDSPFNCINGDSKVSIIASGLTYAYMEALRALRAEEKVSVLKLSTLYPLPQKLLAYSLMVKRKY